MSKLNFYPGSEINDLIWPVKKDDLSLTSSASEFFTDFSDITPLVVQASSLATEINDLMLKAHVKLKIVVDSKKEFRGIITLEEINERIIIQKTSQGFSREDLTVSDLMVPKSQLSVFDYEEVAKASIGDVVHALKDSGKHHCLVVDRKEHRIRGIFSASDISRKLHLPVNIQEKSSFYKVFAEVGT